MNLSCSSIFILIIMVVLTVQCGTDDEQQVDESNSEDTEETIVQEQPQEPSSKTKAAVEVPNFPRPENICGEPGFKYLLSVYFYPYCNKCHGNGDIASAAADEAYSAMITIENDSIRKIVTAGQFCTGDCRLKEGDSILADIDVWLAQKDSCPMELLKD